MRFVGVLLVLACACSTSEPAQPSNNGTVLARVPGGAALVVDDNFAYVAGGGISRIPLDGGSPTIIAQAADREALDDDALYFSVFSSDPDAGEIMRLPKDGGAAQVLATGDTRGVFIAVDASYVYWSAQSTFMRVSKGGGVAETLMSNEGNTATPGISGFAVDDSKLYWAVFRVPDAGYGFAPTYVFRASKDGGPPEALADAGLGFPTAVAVDDGGVYWNAASPYVEFHASTVRYDKATGQITSLSSTSGPDATWALAVAVDATNVYWLAFGGIYATPLNGGAATMLARVASAQDMAVHHGGIYWLDYDYDAGAVMLRTRSTP